MPEVHTCEGAPCTLLIADDDVTSRFVLRALARRLGFTIVAEATNGDEAIAAAARTKPDIVLLDVCMPLQTGPDALPALLEAHPSTRVVMLTSMADEGTVRECIERGAADYVRKDTPVEEIGRVLIRMREELGAAKRQKENHGGGGTLRS